MGGAGREDCPKNQTRCRRWRSVRADSDRVCSPGRLPPSGCRAGCPSRATGCWSRWQRPRRRSPGPCASCAASRADRRLGPLHEGLFDPSVGLGVRGQQLQTWPRAHHIVRQGQHDPAGIAVVGHLIARAAAQDPSHIGVVGRIGRQAIGVGPVAAIVLIGDRRVVASPQYAQWRVALAQGLAENRLAIHESTVSAPGGTSLLNCSPRRLELAASFEAKYLSASIWSVSLCCSTLPASPAALAGPWAFWRIVSFRSSATALSHARRSSGREATRRRIG